MTRETLLQRLRLSGRSEKKLSPQEEWQQAQAALLAEIAARAPLPQKDAPPIVHIQTVYPHDPKLAQQPLTGGNEYHLVTVRDDPGLPNRIVQHTHVLSRKPNGIWGHNYMVTQRNILVRPDGVGGILARGAEGYLSGYPAPSLLYIRDNVFADHVTVYGTAAAPTDTPISGFEMVTDRDTQTRVMKTVTALLQHQA